MYDFGLGGATASVIGARIVSSAKECRANASECLDLARQTSDLTLRASLLEMAQKWLDLAELCEHNAWNETLRMRAIQAAIGRELQSRYELRHELPPHILALLVELEAERDRDGAVGGAPAEMNSEREKGAAN